MQDLTEHYASLIGLHTPWQVTSVDLQIEDQRVVVHVDHPASCKFACPSCDQQRPLKDHAEQRSWRHLDTMQFQTVLVAKTPRTNCPACGVKTVNLPWAEPHGRFTLLFEAWAVKVLQACANIERARVLLGLSWKAVHEIVKRAVERGVSRRDLEGVKHVGVDEKSFRRGQDYVSVMTDLTERRVIDVVEGRTGEDADRLFAVLNENQREQIEAVAMDMSAAFEGSAERMVPQAAIVFDRFHIAKAKSDAVDQVRRAEHKQLLKDGDRTLAGTRYAWLKDPKNHSAKQRDAFERLRHAELKTARAWAIASSFERFWSCANAEEAKGLFDRWHDWASRCGLTPMQKLAKTLKRRMARILTWFEHRISNGVAEGFNSKIQGLKSAARGFRNFENYRLRILFFCGRLDLAPEPSH